MKVVYETMMERIRQASEDAIARDQKISHIELSPSEMKALEAEVYSSYPLRMAHEGCGFQEPFSVHGVKIKAAPFKAGV